MISNIMGRDTDLGGDEDLGGGFGGLAAYQPPVGPVAPIAVDPMCKWCTRVGK